MQHALIAVIVILVLLVIVLAVLLGIFIGRHYFCHCRHHHCESHIDREQHEQRTAEGEEYDESITHVLSQHNDANDVVIGSDSSALRERRQRRWEQEHIHDERNSHEEYNDLELHSDSNNINREISEIPISSLHQNNNNSGNNNVDIDNRLEMHNHEPTLISATSGTVNTNINVLHNNRHSATSVDNINSSTNNNNNELHSVNDDNDIRQSAMATRYSPVELTGVAIENRIRPRSHLPKGTVVVEHDDRQYIIHFSEIEEIPQAAPPPLSAEELSFMEAARHRVASPEFYGRAEYLHGSHCSSIKGLPLRRKDSAASVTSLSAYDSNVDNMNRSINRSNYYVNGNNNVHEGNASMTSEGYKAWHALHAPYFYNNNDNGDKKSFHGASSNGSIASLANYSFRPASQAGSLYRADDSSSSHHSKEYKYNANDNKANKQSNYNYNKDDGEERKRVKENDAVNEEEFTIRKENNMSDKSKANEFCVSHNDKQISNNKVKGPSTMIALDDEGDDEEDGYKISCSDNDDDDDDSQRAQDAFMRHQQMRVAYYTDPARHQRMTNLYKTKHYNTTNNSKNANNIKANNNNDKKNFITEELHANNALQEGLSVNSHKSKLKNNEQGQENRQQEQRRKRHDAYESTSDDMEDDDNNSNKVEQLQRAQLLQRQQRSQTQQKQEHSLTSSKTLKAQEEQQNSIMATTYNNKIVINNNLNSEDADNKYKMTIIAPMLNDGNNITSNNNRNSINNQRYVLPLTALGLEQITNYTTDRHIKDAGASEKEFTSSSTLRTSERKANVQLENTDNMCEAANKVQLDNMQSNTSCVITKTAVVPLSEVIIMPAVKDAVVEQSLSCSTLSAPSLTNNALPVNTLIQGAQVDDTPPNAKSINHAELSIAPAEKNTNT